MFPGKPSNSIDTSTFIELETEDQECRIFFSTNGDKPNPFNRKPGGRESTFKYKGPFAMKSGKRTLKVIAVSRDGLHESNVVTKTFNVADVGVGDVDDDVSTFTEDAESSIDLFFEEKNKLANSKKKKKPKAKPTKKDPFEAWGDITAATNTKWLCHQRYNGNWTYTKQCQYT